MATLGVVLAPVTALIRRPETAAGTLRPELAAR